MTTTLNKVQVFIEDAENTVLASDNVSIAHRLNDISTASVSLTPRTVEDIEAINNIEENLFKDLTIKVVINDQEHIAFKGSFVGGPVFSSPVKVGVETQLYGNLYKLTQLSVTTLGLHNTGSQNHFRIGLNANSVNKVLFEKTIPQLKGKNLIESLKTIIITVADLILGSLSLTQDDPGTPFGSINNAVLDLYGAHATQNRDLVSQELDKIILVDGIEASSYEIMVNEQVKQIILGVSESPSVSFWDFLIALCESYQVNIGTYSDKIYAIPNHPVGKPAFEIQPGDVSNTSISPLPVKFPTRCYLSVTGGEGENLSGLPVLGSFPPIDEASEATELEKKLGAIRTLFYERPAFTLHVTETVNSVKSSKGVQGAGLDRLKELQQVFNNFAQIYLVKETFKQRTGSLTMRYFPDIVVGAVVRFEDPFFRRGYQGYVTQVQHSLNANGMVTSVSLQYVIGDREKEFLGLEEGGYLNNPIYPNYEASNLLEALGINS